MGELLLIGSEKGLCTIRFLRGDSDLEATLHAVSDSVGGSIPRDDDYFSSARQGLDRYFSGRKEDFRDVETDFRLGTAYQARVWAAARNIPYGRTAAYRELAHRLGHAGYRSVGQALNRNPLLIIVPCHRVVAADGGIGGFGAGLELKRRLLALEGIDLQTFGLA